MLRVRICYIALFFFYVTAECGYIKRDNQEIDCNVIDGLYEETRKNIFEKDIRPWKKFNDVFKKEEVDELKSRSYGEFLEKVQDISPKVIFPGTLWCGAGNISKDQESLGRYKDTDACCKEHDECKSNIEAGEKFGNLWNSGKYTRSACFCDFKFYNCLKEAKSFIVASSVGNTYFNILGPQCFECVCPTDGCNSKEDEMGCKDRCKKFKWRDNKKF